MRLLAWRGWCAHVAFAQTGPCAIGTRGCHSAACRISAARWRRNASIVDARVGRQTRLAGTRRKDAATVQADTVCIVQAC